MSNFPQIAGSRTPAWLAVAIVALAAPAGAGQTSVERQSGDDLYVAGVSVQVSRPVTGDAVLAGGSVLVAQDVGADLLALGGTLTLTHSVGDDVRAAGGSITVTDHVGGDAILAGGSVTLGPESRVAGNAWLAGGALRLSGTVKGNLRAAGGEVIIGGRVDGDARIFADSLRIESGAVIDGTVHYEGPHPPRVSGGAQVSKLIYTERRFRGSAPLPGGLVSSLILFSSLAVCSLILAWLLPNASREAAENARQRMFLSLAVGLLAVIVTPFVVAVLFALLLTAPLAVILLASYVILLAAGCLVAVVCLGSWLRTSIFPRQGEGTGFHLLSVLAAALVYWVAALIPFVGVLIVLLAFATGAGGLILLAGRLYKRPHNP